MGMLTLALVCLLVSSGVLVEGLKQYCLPTDACWPLDADILTFKAEMFADDGAVVQVEGDQGWPGKLLTYNQAVAKTPGMIVYVGTVSQIRRALRFAYRRNIKVSIISSGHSFPGRCGDEGAMQISVGYMKDIDINLNCTENALGCITTQAGVRWGEAYREAHKYGRIVVGGSAPTVSVTGWTVGGGHSPLSRMFGLGVDNVLQFHLVTADLSEVWTSAKGTKIVSENGMVTQTNDTSLFYGLSGGGSAFGVLMDITFKLHKDAKIGQMDCSYPAFQDGTSKVFDVIHRSLFDLLPKLPSTFSGYLIPSIGCDPVSKQCGGTSVVSLLHYGAVESADPEIMKEVTSLPHKWSAQGLGNGRCRLQEHKSFYDYELTVPNATYTTLYMGGSLIQENLLTHATSDVLSQHFTKGFKKAQSDPTYNMIGTAIWVGGAVRNRSVDDVPVTPGWRNAIFTYSLATAWDPAVTKDVSDRKQDVRDAHKDLDRFSHGKYYNEAELDMEPSQWKREFWSDQGYAKLMSIKKSWDPKNVFTCHQCLGSDWDINEPVIG